MARASRASSVTPLRDSRHVVRSRSVHRPELWNKMPITTSVGNEMSPIRLPSPPCRLFRCQPASDADRAAWPVSIKCAAAGRVHRVLRRSVPVY